MLDSMRARYWDKTVKHRAAPAEATTAAESLDRHAGRFLYSGQPASKAEQLLHHISTTAVRDATIGEPSRLGEQAQVSNWDASVPRPGQTKPEMPLYTQADSQRYMLATQKGEGKLAGITAKGREDLIASIVETGLRIATRMGDRAAAAALCMPEPARATSRSAAQTRPSKAGTQASNSWPQNAEKHNASPTEASCTFHLCYIWDEGKKGPFQIKASGLQYIKVLLPLAGQGKAGLNLLPEEAPATPEPCASKHARPAPGTLAGPQSVVGKGLQEHAVEADRPGCAAKLSAAVSEHEPSQPDGVLEASVPKCQVSCSASQSQHIHKRGPRAFCQSHSSYAPS